MTLPSLYGSTPLQFLQSLEGVEVMYLASDKPVVSQLQSRHRLDYMLAQSQQFADQQQGDR